MTDTTNRLIEKVIEDFDFDKVHKIMVVLDWKKYDGIPTVKYLKFLARDLLEEAYAVWTSTVVNPDCEPVSVSTYGLKASFDGVAMDLEFIAESTEYQTHWFLYEDLPEGL